MLTDGVDIVTCAFSIYTQLLKNILSTYYSQFFTWNRISNLDATFGSCLFTIKIAVASAVLFRNIRAVVVIRGDRRKNIQLISADVAKFILNYDVIITFLNFSVLFIWALGLIEPNKTLIQFHGKITPFFTFLGQLKFLDNQCRWLPNKTQLNLYLSSVQIYFLKLSRYIFIQTFKKIFYYYYYKLDVHNLLPPLSNSTIFNICDDQCDK